ncbi:uncharacterized protein BO97DRAFT_48197 [Aspergillus homomorphus CBS 101889]|uniref:Uncharacterized protein n=1 Tax=Aspergillus homomorphus (strain CBS 101889) TaxID=1450537 RepID=A0A395HZC7_ASPHC|nr:hypothetical protein BO97DRAFT_48197 [Aspergillus homomorphus CBS 101889]RAL12896.1 hypothetical protein BO97DRAFT_48197 [Aspergillus homomorphus CBS 101889]
MLRSGLYGLLSALCGALEEPRIGFALSVKFASLQAGDVMNWEQAPHLICTSALMHRLSRFCYTILLVYDSRSGMISFLPQERGRQRHRL